MTKKDQKTRILEFITSEHKEGRHYNAVEIALKLGLVKHEFQGLRGNPLGKLEEENKIHYIYNKEDLSGKWYPVEWYPVE